MAIVNPPLLDSFDENQANTTTPPQAQQDNGYTVNEIPLSEHHGFMFNQYYSWLNYLKSTGTSQWEVGISYSKHARTMRDQNIYRSLSDANSGNDPLTEPTFWQVDQWRKQTVTHNITVDADYTLTAEQNQFGKVIITDTGVVLTGAVNIIMSDEEKDFILHNDTAQSLTVKTSAGAGILLATGDTKWLLCDGTDVILAAEAIEIASTLEAQAGTNNTKTITPLRLREGLNAGGSAPIYATRAWVNYDGVGVPAIRASGNVSSIGDDGVGLDTVNFITAIPDIDYAMGGAAESLVATPGEPCHISFRSGVTLTTTSCPISIVSDSGQFTDSEHNTLTITR